MMIDQAVRNVVTTHGSMVSSRLRDIHMNNSTIRKATSTALSGIRLLKEICTEVLKTILLKSLGQQPEMIKYVAS